MRGLSAVILLTTTILFVSCKKGGDSPGDNNQCVSMSTIKATPSSATIEKGQTISFQSPTVNLVTYKWQTPAGTVIRTAEGNVSNIDFTNEGWYYLEARNNCHDVDNVVATKVDWVQGTNMGRRNMCPLRGSNGNAP